MKNKKFISAAVVALLAPTLLNSQIVLAEAIATNDSSEATTENSSEATPSSEAIVSGEVVNSTNSEEKIPNTEGSTSPDIEAPVSTTPEDNTAEVDTTTNSSTAEVDSSKNDAISKKDVEIIDPAEGNVVINVLPTKSVVKGSSFDMMAGVSAYDNVSKTDVTKNVTATVQYQNDQNGSTDFITIPTVDTNKEGSYWITYTVKTPNGTATATRWIVVVAENVGMYSIEVADFTLPKNASLATAIENRAIVKDAYGKVIPTADAALFVSGHYSTSETGTISVEVGVVNSEHYTVSTVHVNVTIVDPVEITAPDTTLTVGDTFNAKTYATAKGLDGNGYALSLPVTVVSSDVDTSKPGEYTVEYKAEDTFGNTATKTTKVTVVAPTPKKASITAEDKVMYVGDKLTEDMVLDWATFKNIDGYEYGFEVVGTPIQVTAFGNQIVAAGVYTIRYFATNGDDSVEKTITLTVLGPETPTDPETPKTDDISGTQNNTTNTNNNTKKQPVKEIKKKSEKQLPQTGAKESSMMLTSVGMTLIASVYFMKKRKENEFDLY